jgi:hypothetical protein
MNGLSDSLTIGIVITLVFGALFFYLYSRLAQNEKRVSLIENILLDLKMSADAGWGVHGVGHEGVEEQQLVNHVEPVSPPEPLVSEDVDSSDENIYKEVLAQTDVQYAPPTEAQQDEIKSFDIMSGSGAKMGSPKASVSVTKVQANYEAMSNKELKSAAKARGISVPSQAGKKEIIAALRKADGGAAPAAQSTVEPGSFLGSQEGATLDGEPLGEVESL